MNRPALALILVSNLALATGSPKEALKWATEVDLLPAATGGWYTSIAAGREVWRLRAVAAAVNVPDRFAPAGWEKAQTRALALLVDRCFRQGFMGPWVGAGIERWDEDLKWTQGPKRVRLKSLQATFGLGWADSHRARVLCEPVVGCPSTHRGRSRSDSTQCRMSTKILAGRGFCQNRLSLLTRTSVIRLGRPL